MAFDHDLTTLARRQHGAVAWRQLQRLGYGFEQIQYRIDKGVLIRTTANVVTVSAVAENRAKRAMVAVLDAGDDAFLSHTSAAAWWRISGFQLDPLHVSLERSHRWKRVPTCRVHHATIIPPSERTVLDGVPITSPALTLLHLAGMVAPARLEAAIDNAWSLKLVDRPALDRILDGMAKQGRNGIVAFRNIVSNRPDDWVPPQSNLESRFRQLAVAEGLGAYDCQVELGDGKWRGRVDFRSEELPLVIEIQSERYHAALSDQARDAERRRHIEALGYTLIEVWDSDLFHDGEQVAETIRTAERSLRRPAAPF